MSAILDAEILLAYILKKNKEYLFTYPEKTLTKNQLSRFNKLIAKRSTGIPIAYLTHHKEFFGLDFYVNKNVLIPRPETELLVDETLKILNLLISQSSNFSPTIADIGTGSGAIPVAIASNVSAIRESRLHSLPIKILATDISKPALKMATKNANLHATKITFLHGNLLTPIKHKKIDIIVANLPYVESTDLKKVTPNTIGLKFEPKDALYSGPDGLDAYRQFFTQAAKLKHKPKFILIEYGGPQQTAELKKIIKAHFPTAKIQNKKDLCGLDRVIIIKL